jgi:hypothetical protein
MEFGIGFVLGGVSTGMTVGNWGNIVKAIQSLAAKAQDAIGAKLTKLK